jgi:hypothetical protein
LPSLSPLNGKYDQLTAVMKKKWKNTMTVVIVSPQKRGNTGDKGTSKKPPIMPIQHQPGELTYIKTIATNIEKEELLEQLMTYYPFKKDTTITPPLIIMMKPLPEEAP